MEVNKTDCWLKGTDNLPVGRQACPRQLGKDLEKKLGESIISSLNAKELEEKKKNKLGN